MKIWHACVCELRAIRHTGAQHTVLSTLQHNPALLLMPRILKLAIIQNSSLFSTFKPRSELQSDTMPLEIRVQGEAIASRLADMVEIHIAFKSKGLYRNEASTALSKAVEALIDTLQKLSPTLKNQHSLFQATPEGPITSWSVGAQHVQTQSVPISQTKTYQENHMVTASLVVNIRDFQILGQVSRAITRTSCVASVKTTWSLTDSVVTRLKTEVHELAAKDALLKATAIASSIGFHAVTAEDVALQASKQDFLRSDDHYSDGNCVRPSPVRHRRGGCLPYDDYDYGGGYFECSDSKWTSRDEAGNLDTWTLVMVPKQITLTATVDAKFSAISSAGWVYEDVNQHRFLTS